MTSVTTKGAAPPAHVAWPLLVLLLVPVVVHAPHTLFNLADRNWDFDQHYAWALQFSQGLRAGDPYPRWMPLGNYGLGEPSLLYYSPLYYYVVAALHSVTGSIWGAMKLTNVLSTFVVGWFAWRLLCRHLPPWPALLGAVLCQATPMVFMLFHYFNGFPWAANAACLAGLLWALPANVSRPSPDRLVSPRISVAVAALVLTHIVSALMALICVSAALVMATLVSRHSGRARWNALLMWAVSAALGLALAGAYVVPALASTGLIDSGVWTRDYTPYDAFAFPTWTTWRYGMRWFAFQWPAALIYLGLALAAVWTLRRRAEEMAPERRDWTFFLLAVTFTALFLTSELSFPLWLLPTPLQKVQFPHRFLFICALTAPLALSLAWGFVNRPGLPHHVIVAATAAYLITVAMTVALSAKIVLRDGEPVVLVDPDSMPYRSFREYTMRTQGSEWRSYVEQGGLAAECARAGVRCEVVRASSRGFEWRVEATASTTLRLPVLDFPAWMLRLNGQPVGHRLDPPTGLVTVDVPSGHHAIILEWTRLPSELAGATTTAIAAALLLVAGLSSRRVRVTGSR